MNRVLFYVMASLIATVMTLNTEAANKKYQMRGVWVATVANIDWPSKRTLSVAEQQQEIINMLDSFKRDNINTVIFQARPQSDAFYESKTEPWSMYLTGEAGKATEPYYDPLQFIIDETHKRFMELHVWINPYRALNYPDTAKFAPNHVFRSHQEMFVQYGGKFYFDPGLESVRTYLSGVVCELLRNYDLDAIVFDDYFYPYPVPNEKFPDDKSFKAESRGFKSKEDWRRDNVDLAIKMISDSIKQIKPWVQFGISPFGVWRHKKTDPRGSDSFRGLTNYDDLYADVLKWIDNGWIDYVSPQLYWEIGKKNADYAKLLPWWVKNKGISNLYISMYSSGYTAYAKNKAWQKPVELLRQMHLNRKNPQVGGEIFYSAKHYLLNEQNFNDSLRSEFYTGFALVPPSALLDTTKDELRTQQPDNITTHRVKNKATRTVNYWLSWDAVDADGGNEVSYYIVYAFKGKTPGDMSDLSSAIAVTDDNTLDLNDFCKGREGKYNFVVTAVNRYRLESIPKDYKVLKIKP